MRVDLVLLVLSICLLVSGNAAAEPGPIVAVEGGEIQGSFEAGGEIAVCGPDGTWRDAALLPGGVLLRRWAWLRYRTSSGRIAVELTPGGQRTVSQADVTRLAGERRRL